MGPDTIALLQALARDRFLLPLPLPAADTLTAFLRPKSLEKAAFIADLRAINTLTPQPLPHFKLPSVEHLVTSIASQPRATLWGITIDLTNFYWSLSMPLMAHSWFRIHNLAFDSLPFGWNLSPVIAQETLSHLLDLAITSNGLLPFLQASLFSFLYLDDILFLCSDRNLLQTVAFIIPAFLTQAGLLVSPKSHLTPSRTFTWLGKHFY